MTGSFKGLIFLDRKVKSESASLAQLAFDVQRSPMGGDDFVADTQPQPRSGGFGREEGMEKFGEILFGNSATRILDGDRNHFFL
jgi:hypothetical protein